LVIAQGLLNVGAGVGAYDVVKLIAENSLPTPVVVLNATITNKYWTDGYKGAVTTGELEGAEVATLVTLVIVW